MPAPSTSSLRFRRALTTAATVAATALVLAACTGGAPTIQTSPGDGASDTGVGASSPATGTTTSSTDPSDGKIKHIVIVMQENRSFDQYFGTFPGADGFALGADGRPKVCVPNPEVQAGCTRPWLSKEDISQGGPH